MSRATRIGDGTSGICNPGLECCPHSRAGTNSTGSPNVFCNGKAIHRQGDFGNCNCPHGGNFESTGCSKTVFINGRGATRIGDETTCMNCAMHGSHVEGSNNVFIGG